MLFVGLTIDYLAGQGAQVLPIAVLDQCTSPIVGFCKLWHGLNWGNQQGWSSQYLSLISNMSIILYIKRLRQPKYTSRQNTMGDDRSPRQPLRASTPFFRQWNRISPLFRPGGVVFANLGSASFFSFCSLVFFTAIPQPHFALIYLHGAKIHRCFAAPHPIQFLQHQNVKTEYMKTKRLYDSP